MPSQIQAMPQLRVNIEIEGVRRRRITELPVFFIIPVFLHHISSFHTQGGRHLVSCCQQQPNCQASVNTFWLREKPISWTDLLAQKVARVAPGTTEDCSAPSPWFDWGPALDWSVYCQTLLSNISSKFFTPVSKTVFVMWVDEKTSTCYFLV